MSYVTLLFVQVKLKIKTNVNMSKITIFNNAWLAKYSWVRECKLDNRKAFCCLCKKSFALSKMGESALKSHMVGTKHKANECRLQQESSSAGLSLTNYNFVLKQNSTDKQISTGEIPTPPQPGTSVKPRSISDFTAKNDTLRAEILWSLKTISDHASYRSNQCIGVVFRTMFPDSLIASKFACGERKTAYLCVFGLAPYFLETLKSKVKGKYCVLFDESLNKKTQKKQMDIHVRYWTPENQVVTTYFGSQFLGHATAEKLLHHFEKGVLESGLDVKDLQQVSMDGPNVNWAFLALLKKKLHDDYGSSIINIGSCGLHIIHNSFKSGATASGWEIGAFLTTLYYLFKDSPARVDDYMALSQTKLKPLKFVNHRWLENIPVCNRALDILEDIKKFVKSVEEKKLPIPTCKSFETVNRATKDKLLVPKLQFFKFVATHLQPFLSVYQTDRPMVPFLAQDLSQMVRGLMRCYLKSDCLQNPDGKLSRVVEDEDSRLNHKDLELGLLTEKYLKEQIKNGVSGRQILSFKMDAIKFLDGVVKKILKKCPLSYSLVRQLSSLNPKLMATKQVECRRNFKAVLNHLVEKEKLNADECDVTLKEYGCFLDQIPVIGTEKFVNFNHENEDQRLDQLFTVHMADPCFSHLLKMVRSVLVLSHGQASVERGFSINKALEIENMKEETLVAQRMICDQVKAVGGVCHVPLTNALIVSCAMARQKYEIYLEKQKEERQTQTQNLKRKADLEEIKNIKTKKQRIETDIVALTLSADNLALKAENTNNITLLVKSNAFRKSASEKKTELAKLKEKLETKQEELKLCHRH